MNGSVVRLGVVEGEYHWHHHDDDDEFFYVVDGELLIDLEDRTVTLAPGQGFVVPKGVRHRTRAPRRTVMLMVENAGIVPTGDGGVNAAQGRQARPNSVSVVACRAAPSRPALSGRSRRSSRCTAA